MIDDLSILPFQFTILRRQLLLQVLSLRVQQPVQVRVHRERLLRQAQRQQQPQQHVQQRRQHL